jgi:hypothetical protein
MKPAMAVPCVAVRHDETKSDASNPMTELSHETLTDPVASERAKPRTEDLSELTHKISTKPEH